LMINIIISHRLQLNIRPESLDFKEWSCNFEKTNGK